MAFNIARYLNRVEREFEVEVVTPMFLGGANLGQAELRTPSLKGMIRFWWRATCDIESIENLKQTESEIFGSTAQKSALSVHIADHRQSEAVLKNLPKGKMFQVKSSRGTFKLGILDYLSFGLRDRKLYTRAHYPPGTTFIVKLACEKSHEASVLRAFRTFVDFGGLGARSRNGFGCLKINDDRKPSIQLSGPLKSYSATTERSDVFITAQTSFKTWEDALSEIGMAYKDARLSLEPKHRYQKRLLIAKPIVQAGGNQKARHAKPYFLHVGKTPGGFFGQILFMPYRYLAGTSDFSAPVFQQYLESCNQMNRVIRKKLSGGAQ